MRVCEQALPCLYWSWDRKWQIYNYHTRAFKASEYIMDKFKGLVLLVEYRLL